MSDMPPTIQGPMRVQSAEAPGGTAGLVLGILSIVLGGVPVVGLILGMIGLSKSRTAKAACEMHPGFCTNAGTAQAGFVCSIVGICLSSLSTLATCCYFSLAILMIFGAAAGAGAGAGP